MKQGQTSRLLSVLAMAGLTALTSCGRPTNTSQSDLKWIQEKTQDVSRATLEMRDLTDEFLFGLSVIEVKDFPTSALNLDLGPLITTLNLNTDSKGKKSLSVVTAEQEAIMTFDVTTIESSKLEIDFASVGNDLTFNALIDYAGAIFSTGGMNAVWTSKGAPVVKKIQQDSDTLVVDLVHKVIQDPKASLLSTVGDALAFWKPKKVDDRTPGEVTVRVYLKRRSSLASVIPSKSVAQGFERNIGFFGSSMIGAMENPRLPIQRFALGEGDGRVETFYLKDVPEKFQDAARKAILSWNAAFDGKEVIKVELAPEGLDVGDPRFNVVKWYDGLDKSTGWAGIAKMMVDPETGVVFAGNLYINGSTVLDSYVANDEFTRQAAEAMNFRVDGTIGQGSLVFKEGETPVVPFFTDIQAQGYENYMQGYYLATIAHEVGHVLGLRHNFRGGNTLTETGGATSVMAYLPRSVRNRDVGPGSYDIAAIQWGYLGKDPSSTLEFCTDEHVENLYDCNRGTYGEPVQYTSRSLIDGAKLLSALPLKIKDEETLLNAMGEATKNLFKMVELADQMPEVTRESSVKSLKEAFDFAKNIKPATGLADEHKVTVQENLGALAKVLKKAVDELPASRRVKMEPGVSSQL